jgi:L-threonylcarbamoyladenylate synthase
MLETEILSVTDIGAIARAATLLLDGQVVAFPTDTVYGLGAHPLMPSAVAALYEVKERPAEKAIPLLLTSAAEMRKVADPVPDLAWLLAERFWPGALTLVLPKGPTVIEAVSSGPGVAVRVPDYRAVQGLIAGIGGVMAVTSANHSGAPSPVTAQDVVAQLGGRVPLVLDGGPCRGGVSSTVLDLTVDPPRILRPGVLAMDIHAFIEARQTHG